MKGEPGDLAFKGELVRFLSSDNLVLHGFLCRPKGSDKVVLHLHGLQGAFYRNATFMQLGKDFVKSGFSFLTIEQRGSYGITAFSRIVNGEPRTVGGGGSIEKFEESIHDIRGAIKYLKDLGFKNIYLQGHSTGCQKATYYLSKQKDLSVKALILLAPADDYNIWKRELGPSFNSAVKFARKVSKKNPKFPMNNKYEHIYLGAKRFMSVADPKSTESKIFNYDRKKLTEFSKIRVPIFAAFGTKEEYAVKPVPQCLRILGRNTISKNFKAVLVNGGDHGFRGKEPALSGAVIKWLKSL